jgi:hypothetical protein
MRFIGVATFACIEVLAMIVSPSLCQKIMQVERVPNGNDAAWENGASHLWSLQGMPGPKDSFQSVAGIQRHDLAALNVGPGLAAVDQPIELYCDDAWYDYRGAWRLDPHASRWTVVLTLMLSILAVAGGYWLFARIDAKRSRGAS